jgi:hypothetical protein
MEGTAQLDPAVADFVGAIYSQVHRGAYRVAACLRYLGMLPANDGRPATPVALPAELLLGLDQALRFADWEDSQIFVHVEAGLPSAEEHLAKVIALQRGPELKAIVTDIAAKVIGLISQHFVWSVAVESQADLAISGDVDDAFLDAVADFLWQHRHTGS